MSDFQSNLPDTVKRKRRTLGFGGLENLIPLALAHEHVDRCVSVDACEVLHLALLDHRLAVQVNEVDFQVGCELAYDAFRCVPIAHGRKGVHGVFKVVGFSKYLRIELPFLYVLNIL